MERLILDSRRAHPHNLDAGIEHAMRALEGLISDAEGGDPRRRGRGAKAAASSIAGRVSAWHG